MLQLRLEGFHSILLMKMYICLKSCWCTLVMLRVSRALLADLKYGYVISLQQLGGMANQLGPGGGLELRVIQNPNLSIDLNSLQMSGLTNNSNITFTTVPVSSLNPVTSLHNPIISSTNNLPSLENTAVPLSAHSPKGPAWTSLSNLTQHRLL